MKWLDTVLPDNCIPFSCLGQYCNTVTITFSNNFHIDWSRINFHNADNTYIALTGVYGLLHSKKWTKIM